VPEAAEPAARVVERAARAQAPARQVAELPGAPVRALAGAQAEPPVHPEVRPPAEDLPPETLVRVEAAALPTPRPRTRI